jgi:hypothetical protein
MKRRVFLTSSLGALAFTSGCNGIDIGQNPGRTGTKTPKQETVTLPSIRDVEDRYDEDRTQFSSEGDSTTDTFETSGQATAVTWEYTGSDHFVATLVDADGEDAAYPASEGDYSSGARVFPLPAGQYHLGVKARGPWNLGVAEPEPPESAIQSLPAEATGSGDNVVGPVNLNGDTVFSAAHDGEDWFRVRAIGMWGTSIGDSAMFINENGSFDGESTGRYEGDVWIDVEADGEWSLTLESTE